VHGVFADAAGHVPAQPDPTFEPFKTALQAYVDQTQPFRKAAAQEAERVPGKAAADAGAEQSVRARQSSLADALRTRLRPNARQGDVVTQDTAAAITREIQKALNTPKRDLILDELAEQNETSANASSPTVNQKLDAPRVPPRLMEILPPLPKQLEYARRPRARVRRVDADAVVDYALTVATGATAIQAAGDAAIRRTILSSRCATIHGGTVFG
jgi:hypothetical protein